MREAYQGRAWKPRWVHMYATYQLGLSTYIKRNFDSETDACIVKPVYMYIVPSK